eukprot:COSAG02_NODE_1295_length_13400_cov_5.691828_24_plen_46_part_00
MEVKRRRGAYKIATHTGKLEHFMIDIDNRSIAQKGFPGAGWRAVP